MEIEQVVTDLGKAFAEFKAANDANQAKHDAVLDDKVAKLSAALDTLQTAKDDFESRLADAEKRAARPIIGAGGDPEAVAREVKAFNDGMPARGRAAPVSADGVAAYRKAFGAFLRGDERALDDSERKAMTVGVDPDGGYFVPPTVSGRIVTRIFETSPVRQIASVQTIGTDALEGMQDTDEAGNGGWVGETTAPTDTTTPKVGKWRITVGEMFAQPKATQRLLDDSTFDVEGWLAGKVADRLTRLENAAFINGTGVGQPRGLCTYPTAATADATRAWGTFEHAATGVSSAFAASNPSDLLLGLIQSFKDGYLQNARWLTRREVVGLIRKFKAAVSGDYLWQPGLQAGMPQQILGYPVTIAQDMPTLANGSLSMAFGNFAEVYQIVDRAGFRTVRDALTDKPYVKFWTSRRVGGGAVQFEAVKFVKFGS